MDIFNIYLPVANLSVNVLLLICVGAGVGMISGIFGVGGGFIIAPLLFFLGIPPSIAVATSANQVLATAVAGTLVQHKHKQIDYKMGNYMLVSGIFAVMIGSLLFSYLKSLGQIDFFVRIAYIFFLICIGIIILQESFWSFQKRTGNKLKLPFAFYLKPRGTSPLAKKILQKIYDLPQVEYFPISHVRISIWLPIILGGLVGFFSAILGVGGSIIAHPFMNYLLKMPSKIVIGTSIYQIVFITTLTSLMQALLGQSLDIILAICLTIGGVAGSPIGTRFGHSLSPDILRMLFSLLVLILASVLLAGLFIAPRSPFILSTFAP